MVNKKNQQSYDVPQKTKALEKELQEQTKLAEERLDSLKYLQADFDNYRKQFEKEKERLVQLANENLIKELLVIVDDFEAALQSIENEKNKEGLMMLHRNFFKILESNGIKRIEALGRKFDPYLHEAVSIEKTEKEDGIILEEIQPGYFLKSKVLRHTKVKVGENKQEAENNG